MAHTNETANYHLSQFVGTDIPNPLVDYNGDMVKIDTAIKGVADASAGYASDIADLEIQNGSETLTTTAQTLSGAVNELDSEVGDINTRLTTAEGKITADEGTLATAVSNISTLAGKVGAVETKVGTAVLTTVAPDLSGAVNELKAEIDGAGSSIASRVTALETQCGNDVLVTTAQTLSGAINELAGGTGAISASNVTYDNTTSGLTADDVQEAIDEINAKDAGDIAYDNQTSGLVATNVQSAIDEIAGGEAPVDISSKVTPINGTVSFAIQRGKHITIMVSNATLTNGYGVVATLDNSILPSYNYLGIASAVSGGHTVPAACSIQTSQNGIYFDSGASSSASGITVYVDYWLD